MEAKGKASGAGRGGAVVSEGGAPPYKTARWVQVWFLRRSRDNWKRKYMALKADAKRLQNRVNDVTKSRERWRALAEGARDGAGPPGEAGGGGGCGAAAPADAGAALKKGGPGGGEARRGRRG